VRAYDRDVLVDAPLGYWPMDESSGTSGTDLGSVGATGTYTGAVVNSAKFLDGGPCPYFDGNGDWLDVGDNNAWSIDNSGAGLTFEIWAAMTNLAPGANKALAWKSGTSGGSYEWHVSHLDAPGVTLTAQMYTSAANPISSTDITLARTFKWRHVVVYFPGTSTTSYPQVWINGKPMSGTSTAGSGAYTNGTGTVRIGGREVAGATQSWVGYLARCAIYGKAPTAHMLTRASRLRAGRISAR
jgi:hypothetical protein